jgi:hypothetical protein
LRRTPPTWGWCTPSTSTPASTGIPTANRRRPPRSIPCYGGPLGFEPGGTHPDWADTAARRAAQALALARVEESFEATTTLQTLASSPNAARRFFLTYVNSFNEWHEGSQFEPARDYADLSAEERRIGYHNPPDGTARLRHLRTLLDTAMAPPARAR